MNNPAQQIEIFRDFAKQELKDYIRELKTRYQNCELISNDLGLKSFSKHLQIFEKELPLKLRN